MGNGHRRPRKLKGNQTWLLFDALESSKSFSAPPHLPFILQILYKIKIVLILYTDFAFKCLKNREKNQIMMQLIDVYLEKRIFISYITSVTFQTKNNFHDFEKKNSAIKLE